MYPIGRVKTITPKGHLVLVSERPPRIGELALDDRARPVGKVIRIFGPVRRPYLAVLPFRERSGDLLGLLGKPLFKDERGGRHAKKEKNRRRR